METNVFSDIPSWLSTPPTSQVNPPVTTKAQELPIQELRWEDFERLCLQLVRSMSTVEFCRMYGERGEKQEGIDLYARKMRQEKYLVYQCKKVKYFNPAQIKSAVAKFLDGGWRKKSDCFILCTQDSLKSTKKSEAIELERKKLKKESIKFSIWDRDELSSLLKNNSQIVNDFFGREWVKRFCGEEASKNLKARLSPNEILDLRDKLKSFYIHLFNEHDPSLPISAGQIGALTLEERYVIPDVYEERTTYYPLFGVR